jgi:hypothetical protein
MTNLSETNDKYIQMRNFLEIQHGVKVKKFICDGHCIYMSTKMKTQFLKDSMVVKYRSPYCPQQNSISERRLRTTIKMARTILIHLGMKTKYWEDAVIHSNYIRNRVIIRVFKRMTPYEKFWGKKPDLCWTRPFSCLAYVLIHKEQRKGKFDAIALLGVHLGAFEKHSGYRILMLKSKKMKVFRDVRFYKDVYPYRMELLTDLTLLNPIDYL